MAACRWLSIFQSNVFLSPREQHLWLVQPLVSCQAVQLKAFLYNSSGLSKFVGCLNSCLFFKFQPERRDWQTLWRPAHHQPRVVGLQVRRSDQKARNDFWARKRSATFCSNRDVIDWNFVTLRKPKSEKSALPNEKANNPLAAAPAWVGFSLILIWKIGFFFCYFVFYFFAFNWKIKFCWFWDLTRELEATDLPTDQLSHVLYCLKRFIVVFEWGAVAEWSKALCIREEKINQNQKILGLPPTGLGNLFRDSEILTL